MILLDRDGEDFVFENEWDIAIPLSIELINGNEPKIEVFPKIEHIASELEKRFLNDLLSDEALAWLWDAVKPYLDEWGYSDDKFRDRWGYIFRAKEVDTACDGVVLLYGCAVPKNRTTLDIEYCIGQGHAAAAVIRDGEIVSAAMTHEPIDELVGCGAEFCEIGVETVPEYRKNGYAKSTVGALNKFLKEKGLTAEYRCQRYNDASYKTAEGAGMEECGRFYSYVLRKNI